MFNFVTPEKAGISSKNVEKFITALDKNGLVMHSVIMMKGDNIFCEKYWEPFDKDFCHRMYSQTKSYVGIAIGILEELGKIKLNDYIVDYFPELIDKEIPKFLTSNNAILFCLLHILFVEGSL